MTTLNSKSYTAKKAEQDSCHLHENREQEQKLIKRLKTRSFSQKNIAT